MLLPTLILSQARWRGLECHPEVTSAPWHLGRALGRDTELLVAWGCSCGAGVRKNLNNLQSCPQSEGWSKREREIEVEREKQKPSWGAELGEMGADQKKEQKRQLEGGRRQRKGAAVMDSFASASIHQPSDLRKATLLNWASVYPCAKWG